jgi:hypothetical protein
LQRISCEDAIKQLPDIVYSYYCTIYQPFFLKGAQMSRRFILGPAVLVLMVVSLLVGGPSARGGEPQNIILIGWDGAQRDHVNQSLGRKELPNLQKLIDEGTYVEIDIEGATDTKAGWAQILTGYYPAVTGVYSNKRYQPIPKGLTVFERLEEHFGPDNVVTLAVIGKKGNVDADGPKKVRLKDSNKESKTNTAPTKRKPKRRRQGKIIEEDGVKYRLVPGKPYYYTKDSMDLFENGLKLDEKVGTRAIALIEKYKEQRFFFFVHFAEVDQKGHKHGENSKEYNDALISNDLWTGKIIAKLKELGLYGKTMIYVTADHGFNEGETRHSNAPHVFLATSDKNVIRNGRRQDIAPTMLERFGLDIARLAPSLDGVPLSTVDTRPEPKLGPQPAMEADPQTSMKGVEKAGNVQGGTQGNRKAPRAARKRLMREGFDEWLTELTKAYQENDREKMGQLLQQMRQHRKRLQERRAGRLGR